MAPTTHHRQGQGLAPLPTNFLEGLETQKRVGGSWESKVQGCIRGAVLRAQAQLTFQRTSTEQRPLHCMGNMLLHYTPPTTVSQLNHFMLITPTPASL